MSQPDPLVPFRAPAIHTTLPGMSRHACITLSLLIVSVFASCERQRYFPELAGPPFPERLHEANAVDIQVFRKGTSIELVNATPREYRDFKLWVNQRYMKSVDHLEPGQTLRLSLWEFHDERGEVMNAGGFFRAYEPTPVRMVQMQLDDESPLIGLIAVRRDPLEEQERIDRR